MAVSVGSEDSPIKLYILDGYESDVWARQEPYTGISPTMALANQIPFKEIQEAIQIAGVHYWSYNPRFHVSYLEKAGIQLEVFDLALVVHAARSKLPIKDPTAIESPDKLMAYLLKNFGRAPQFKRMAEDKRDSIGMVQMPGETMPEYNIRTLLALYEELGTLELVIEQAQ
jgi:hypothetical protein